MLLREVKGVCAANNPRTYKVCLFILDHSQMIQNSRSVTIINKNDKLITETTDHTFKDN